MIIGDGDAHGTRHSRPVLLVASDTALGVDGGDPIGVARIGEQPLGMRISSGFQFFAVTFEAGLLQRGSAPERFGMAGSTRKLDLIVAVRGLPGNEEPFVLAP